MTDRNRGRDGFEAWLDERLRPLLRLATVLSGSPDLAEDLVQDVLLKCQQRWDRLVDLDHPDAYVRRMLVNEHLSYRRKTARVELRDVAADTADPDQRPGFDQQLVDRQALLAELDTLPPRQRTVLVLRYYEGLDDAAIAAAMGCGASTVRGYATRALATLRVRSITREGTRAH